MSGRFLVECVVQYRLIFGLITIIKGEEICDAVIREVFEETGIKAEFESVLCFRQNSNAKFGLYAIFEEMLSNFLPDLICTLCAS
jgi:hypothetical protein